MTPPRHQEDPRLLLHQPLLTTISPIKTVIKGFDTAVFYDEGQCVNDMNLKWSADYATGIQIIDEQHQRLFDYFEEIATGIAKGDVKGLSLVVHGLVNYAISHNTYEESLMERAGYPLLTAHNAIHETFKDRANAFLQKLEEGADPLKIAEQARIFIGLWLVSHVKQEDRDYVPYVKKLDKKGMISSLFGKLFG